MVAHHLYSGLGGLMMLIGLCAVAHAVPEEHEVPEPMLPGITGHAALTKQLRAAVENQGPTYAPRTHHFKAPGKPTFVNRLIRENSPYLLQHAHNPVNWYPWSHAAFERASALGRPILLSVGYSTCHWCHVMERESFEDIEIARFINQHFVAIKVDREERPDVDEVYMTAVHLLHGRGGWPMTIVMTPDGAPFFGGTYFPARDGDRGQRKGFFSILKDLNAQFLQARERVVEKGRQITQRIRAQTRGGRPEGVPGAEVIGQAAKDFARRFDARWGGFSRRPKFPRPVTHDLLMRYHRRTGDDHALTMVKRTLMKMALGGLYDQVGGGFHRYSVDRRWLVPHFEKMLYDNAQLTATYTAAWQITGEETFARIVHETLAYITREMTHPLGPFYSATDADSMTPQGHREEGYFFTWTPNELSSVIDQNQLMLLKTVYGITPRGNFEGRNILHLTEALRAMSRRLNRPFDTFLVSLNKIKHAVYTARSKRPPPLLDDKVLTSWNGLMIGAFARAGLVFDRVDYIKQAERAAQFILSRLRTSDGRLKRTWRRGVSKLNAYLDDYAYLIAGLLDLFDATGRAEWLTQAIALQKTVDRLYADNAGGYFTTSHDHEKLIVRQKPDYDGAEPSGNSVTAHNLLRLYEYTLVDAYRARADATFSSFAGRMRRNPTSVPHLLSALEMRIDTPLQIILVSKLGTDLGPLTEVIRSTYLPNRSLIRVTDQTKATLGKTIPMIRGKKTIRGRPTAYVCEQGRCERPTDDPAVLREQLTRLSPLYRYRSPAPLLE
ncbi:MAG: thioredoxin domain-containing protein [Myxococcota bacterium]|nr:thioredoxin domain-containing protein [Myxococcota bacterium]